MKIIEQFKTIQGEGKYLGTPSLFIRTTGCNLRCSWIKNNKVQICDTPFSSFFPEKGWECSVSDVILILKNSNIRHLVITGGEPSLQSDLNSFIGEILDEVKCKITIETNGTKLNHILGDIEFDYFQNIFFSISPKLDNSYNQENETLNAIHIAGNKNLQKSLMGFKAFIELCELDYQFKFVVSDLSDISEIIKFKHTWNIPTDKIYLMPQGIDENDLKETSKLLFNQCIEYGFNFTPRMHIDIFGNVRGI